MLKCKCFKEGDLHLSIKKVTLSCADNLLPCKLRPSTWRNVFKAYGFMRTTCVYFPTCTFLKMSLSHMLSFLITPFFSSDSFRLKAKSRSHLFRGVLAWLNTCREMRISQVLHLTEVNELNKATQQIHKDEAE